MGYSENLDHELLRLVKNNDEEFLKVLFKLYYSRLCSYATTFVKVQDIAEEIVQETFIKFWENRTAIQIDQSFKSYVFRSVHNNCINYLKKSEVLRRQSKQMADEIIYHNEVALRNFSPGIIDNLISEELEIKLNSVLNDLPLQARKIFMLSRFEQLSYNEIADTLKISVNTVKTQMKRTLSKLREIFDQGKSLR
jgi:RNA polymerase sigma-70 factor (ECF subfamily)